MNKFSWNIIINGFLTGFLLYKATEQIFITNKIELGLVFAALTYINMRITMHQIEMKAALAYINSRITMHQIEMKHHKH